MQPCVEKVAVMFPLQNKKIYVPNNSTIAYACSQAGYPLDLVCGGQGKCKKCSVEIQRGDKRELVLACKELISHGLMIFLYKENIEKKVNVLTKNLHANIEVDPAVRKIFVSRNNFSTAHCSGDWESIQKHLGLSLKVPHLKLLQEFSNILRDSSINGFTLVLWNDELICIEKGDTREHLYGLAIDLGTTTIAAYLYHLPTGRNIGVYSALNEQTSVGADVISRIVAALSPEGLNNLQNKVIGTINNLIKEAAKETNILLDNIYTIALAGNSVMQHLFLGLNPKHLGRVPFTSITLRDIAIPSHELNISINPQGLIHFLPLIGGFVGADTVAVLLSLPKDTTNKYKLMIDLGTNGEIAIGNNERMLVASTAAGPALEGAGIHFGMRGTDGAIEKVSLSNGKIELGVIGNIKPRGICGSGLIDVIAEMLRMEIITPRGKLRTRDEYLTLNKHNFLSERLEIIDGVSAFILTDEYESSINEKIYISQKDIRAVQLAKGAIYTACVLLIEEYGISGEELDEILLAGAFGNYINLERAQYIGLLPSFENVPVKSIGNAAGAGVQLFLLSRNIQNKATSMLDKINHVELATHPNFQKLFISNTNF